MITVSDLVEQYQQSKSGETRRTLRFLIVQSLSPKTRKVFDYIDDHEYATSHDIAKGLHISIYNASNRVHYLRKCGLLFSTPTHDKDMFIYSVHQEIGR